MDRTAKVQPGTLAIINEDCTKFGPVIAAGPLSKQPHTIAFRVVLVQRDDGSFVVWNQYFPNYPDRGEQNLESGDYFQTHQLVESTQRFAERVVRHSGTLASIYRVPDVRPVDPYEPESVGSFPRLALA